MRSRVALKSNCVFSLLVSNASSRRDVAVDARIVEAGAGADAVVAEAAVAVERLQQVLVVEEAALRDRAVVGDVERAQRPSPSRSWCP